jgi:GT2 family glycosyltransferase
VLRFEGPFNFSTINNFAVARLERDYSHVLFCNNDIEAMHEGWLERMLELGQQPDVGIVGAKLLYGDRRTIQHAGVCLGAFGRAEHYGKFVKLPEDRVEGGYYGTFAVSREMSAVTAACLLTRLDVFREVGGFDEELAVGFGDVDLCLRVGERGYRIVQCSAATLVHHESITRGRNNLHPVDSALFDQKWQAAMDRGDPYFNPGFSPTHHNWGPRNPLHCAIDIRRRVVTLDREHARQAITFSEN